ncbi:oxidoreductase [Aspergillus bombycis]|uniref:Oxidoreductase n=1 Tax=Aspergillus bombycis TaxID=109264 RepID=A0A1F7ZNR9_9EURO|nr:oxidoreductase [Aspergillus bombycis]OGM41097.1 oxidoreductase [Aspergillus bombycis]
MAVNFTQIPTIDLAQAQSPATKPSFLSDLRDAIVKVGFFYVKNHGVPDNVERQFVEQSIRFFNLPLKERLEVEMLHSKHFLGYVREQNEKTAQRTDYRETFNLGMDLAAPGDEEPAYRNMSGPNLAAGGIIKWPNETAIPGFREAMDDYMKHIQALGEDFKVLVAEALDLEPTTFLRFFDDQPQDRLKLAKYPAPSSIADNGPLGSFQGIGPHKDSSFLTFLLQGTPHKGLEVQNKSGEWIPAPPVPGTLVVNIGRMFEALTGGVVTATTHRVSLEEKNFVACDGQPLGPRFSFPMFQLLALDLTREQMTLDMPTHIVSLAKQIKVMSDAEKFFEEMFRDCAGSGLFMARVIKHEDVARKWYPDVLDNVLKAQKAELGH